MVTIQVSDTTAAALAAQAAASGVDLDTYLGQLARSANGLDEQYVREGLDFAREQIARRETSNTPIVRIIAKAQELRGPRK